MKKQKFPYVIKHKIWLENASGLSLLGDGKWELLKAIDQTGSFKDAVEKMDWGYRTTWNKMKTIEKRLGFSLTEKSRGGAGGGGQTVLTPDGKKILTLFEQLHTNVDLEIKKAISEFHKILKKEFKP